LLAAITANPDLPISTLPLFSPLEQQQLLQKWPKTRLKLRGYPIDLDQIESVLAQHPAVAQTHILVQDDGPDDQNLVAYVVPQPGQAPATAELRRFLRAKLPGYMTPSVFITLAALPLTAAGEIDYQALPRPNQIKDNLEESFAAPHNDLERQLLRAWEEVLAIRPIGIRDSFFDLGGHSLLAVRLLAHIEKTTGRKLHLASLFQAPTIEQQAKILQEGSTSLLLPLQPHGSRRPFFCVPGGGDNAFIFTELVRHLGPQQPFYSFRFPKHYNEQTAAARLEDMAAQYIQQIKQLQPDGPYLLGGYCFGGKVAFEMAQQLRAQADQVALVALFECYLPGAAHLADFGQRLRHHLNNFLQLPLQKKLAFMLEMAKRRFLKLSRKLSPDLGRPAHEALGETKYVPKRYPGRLTLFHAAKRNPALYYEPEMGWAGLAVEGIEVYAIPGTHIDAYKEPNVQAWAELIRSCLDRAQA
jgi:thioesterase domain-containing protein/acyl carrier protein